MMVDFFCFDSVREELVVSYGSKNETVLLVELVAEVNEEDERVCDGGGDGVKERGIVQSGGSTGGRIEEDG